MRNISGSFEIDQIGVPAADQGELRYIFILFTMWSFITLCRPQDYVPMLAILRPSLTFGIVTIIAYLVHAPHKTHIYSNTQFKLLLSLLLIMAIGVPFSYYRSASLKNVFDYASIGLMFFILFYHIGNSKKQLRYLLFIYCCGTAIYSVYILIYGEVVKERIFFGAMFDPNDTAFFLINFLPLNLIFLQEKSFIKRGIAISNLFLSLLVLFRTGSRGGLVACLVVTAFLLIKKTRTIPLSIVTKAIIISISLILFWTFSLNKERYLTLTEIADDYNMTDESGRVAIWKIGLRMMFSNPLTGVGMGRFSEGVGKDRELRGLPSSKWQAPHNSFIQVGAEIGAIGMILFVVMSIRSIKIMEEISQKSRSPDLVKISEMAKISFIGHLVGAMFLSQAYSIYWIFYIALSAKLERMLGKEQI